MEAQILIIFFWRETPCKGTASTPAVCCSNRQALEIGFLQVYITVLSAKGIPISPFWNDEYQSCAWEQASSQDGLLQHLLSLSPHPIAPLFLDPAEQSVGGFLPWQQLSGRPAEEWDETSSGLHYIQDAGDSITHRTGWKFNIFSSGFSVTSGNSIHKAPFCFYQVSDALWKHFCDSHV